MSNSDKHAAAKTPADPKAKSDELKDSDLDKVSGGSVAAPTAAQHTTLGDGSVRTDVFGAGGGSGRTDVFGGGGGSGRT